MMRLDRVIPIILRLHFRKVEAISRGSDDGDNFTMETGELRMDRRGVLFLERRVHETGTGLGEKGLAAPRLS